MVRYRLEINAVTEQANASGGVFSQIAILGGRWQPPHLGHVWLVTHILRDCGVPQMVLGIVNPDPSVPPDPHFRKFLLSGNPLTYWERLHIWTTILTAEGLLDRVAIVPMWHPRADLTRERAYLPPKKQRVWIVPLVDEDERDKAEDFLRLGEDVRIIETVDIPEQFASSHSWEVRRKILSGNELWRRSVPDAVVSLFQDLHIEERIRRLYDHEMKHTKFQRL
jgi:hypothetical protein